jgi:hypothetical protein
MTDEEFDLLDELYFVQSYQYLKETLGWEDDMLLATLQLLYQKKFIKCLRQPDEEIFEKVDIIREGTDLFYLASKKGLMEHNAL